MEIKNEVVFEIVKDEKTYRMVLPGGCPLGDAYQCAGMFMDKIVELINEHQATKKKQEEDNKEKEDGEEKK